MEKDIYNLLDNLKNGIREYFVEIRKCIKIIEEGLNRI